MGTTITQALLQYNSAFTPEELEAGLVLFQQRSYKARAFLTDVGAISDYLIYAEQSITRCCYRDDKGEEQTLWMKPEGAFIADYKSFVHQEASAFALQFYEDTMVWMISRQDLLHLYQTYSNWALFGVYLTEQVHISLIDVFVNLLSNDATQNYRYIEYAFPRFLQVAPLKHIASMLQISPVSLSRIRAGKQRKS